MGNSEQSSSGGRAEWAVRLAGVVGGIIVGGLCLLVSFLADLRFPGWQLVLVVATWIGVALGRVAGSRLFRRPPGG
jgi:hypothetical protein